jgi:DNA-binding response OmpR family regulator
MAKGRPHLNGNVDARLLIVDDDPHIRLSLVRALNLMGYQVEAAGSGQQALALMEAAPFDLVILDLRLPDIEGVEVMLRARQIQPTLLIIVLTGRATLDSAIAAVKAHAVDYLLKPASVHDISAVVSAALEERGRRLRQQQLLDVLAQTLDTLRQTETPQAGPPPAGANSEQLLHVHPLIVDRDRREVIVNGSPEPAIALTESEASILICLMEYPDQVLSCQDLASAAWGQYLDEPAARTLVRPHIFRLRRKIETRPNAPKLIRTIRGRGYVFSTTW